MLAEKLQLNPGQPAQVLALGNNWERPLSSAGLRAVTIIHAGGKCRKGTQIAALPSALPMATGGVDAAYMTCLPEPALPTLREWVRVVRPGGWLAIVTTSPPLLHRANSRTTLAAMMLHASLMDIEQRHLGSTWITLGKVRAWL